MESTDKRMIKTKPNKCLISLVLSNTWMRSTVIPKQPDQANTKQSLLTVSCTTDSHRETACPFFEGLHCQPRRVPENATNLLNRVSNHHTVYQMIHQRPTEVWDWNQGQEASNIISRNGMVARMLTSWSTRGQRWGKKCGHLHWVYYQESKIFKIEVKRGTSLHQLHCQPCEMSSKCPAVHMLYTIFFKHRQHRILGFRAVHSKSGATM